MAMTADDDGTHIKAQNRGQYDLNVDHPNYTWNVVSNRQKYKGLAKNYASPSIFPCGCLG
jgi:hypothetical protein